jgi:hypothetical protein
MYPLVLESFYRHNTFICHHIAVPRYQGIALPPLDARSRLRRLEVTLTLESEAQNVAWGLGWRTLRRLTREGVGFEKLDELVLTVEFGSGVKTAVGGCE